MFNLTKLNKSVTHITEGVKVSVRTRYMQDYSSPDQFHFVFGYKVLIQNTSGHTIQLLHRKWEIFDSVGINRVVEGEGVIGQRPILAPGDSHEYTSGCNFKSSMGKMLGTYEFMRLDDRSVFDVTIPEFIMIAPFKLN